ncbi:anti-sigma factor family protein [Parasulfitobacter algicola]|uniref:Zf-HC2 domain-containing protein n=1 Tax=Parasulfitobacter algicola TaxID=2614809 RepID=A0ABX2ILC5_9RHOB|nr:zf-HC2 domain-containing protein [Sulfitobacter algicola]NSX53669.1 zf-HC2 domain-containing protein [Sulfitobacter algicola]
MQLHNPQNPGPEECRGSVWELIPWYVNGSLPSDQAQQVRDHSKGCSQCAAEIERQRRLAKDIIKIDPFDAPLSRSWKHLRAQVKAEELTGLPTAGKWWRFEGLQGEFIALAGVAAVAFAIIVVLPFGNSFETLTTEVEAATHIIKFQTAPNVTADQLDRLLVEFDAVLVSGPSDVGIYEAAVSGGTDMQAVADALMATSQIMFAAPQVSQ